jgi:DNA-binding NtrC family response regulator
MEAYHLKDVDVLVLEKNGHIRNLLWDVLNQLTTQNIENASNIDEALAKYHKFPPDLILSDWPSGLDGIKFLKEMKNHSKKIRIFCPGHHADGEH